MVEDIQQDAEARMRKSIESYVQELSKLREGLRKEVAVLAISGAEKILSREINKADHKDMLDELANKL